MMSRGRKRRARRPGEQKLKLGGTHSATRKEWFSFFLEREKDAKGAIGSSPNCYHAMGKF